MIGRSTLTESQSARHTVSNKKMPTPKTGHFPQLLEVCQQSTTTLQNTNSFLAPPTVTDRGRPILILDETTGELRESFLKRPTHRHDVI